MSDDDGKVYVGNLPYEITEEDLNPHFERFGPLKDG